MYSRKRLYIANLILLDTTGTRGLDSLNGSLVGLDVRTSTRESLHDTRSSLERSLQLARSGSSPKVDLDNVGLQSRLDGRDRLHEQGVGVLHVDVHEPHHGQRRAQTLDLSVNLLQVVLLDRGHNGLGLGGATHRVGRLNVLEGSQVVLLVDLLLDVHANAKDNKLAHNVADSNVEQDVRVFEIDLPGELHHDEHKAQVRDGGIHAEE